MLVKFFSNYPKISSINVMKIQTSLIKRKHKVQKMSWLFNLSIVETVQNYNNNTTLAWCLGNIKQINLPTKRKHICSLTEKIIPLYSVGKWNPYKPVIDRVRKPKNRKDM